MSWAETFAMAALSGLHKSAASEPAQSKPRGVWPYKSNRPAVSPEAETSGLTVFFSHPSPSLAYVTSAEMAGKGSHYRKSETHLNANGNSEFG
jgi:hypothetical protein